MKTERENLRACAEFADRLVDLSDGVLAADERHSVEAHVAGCAGCQAALARLDASLALLRGAVVLRGASSQPLQTDCRVGQARSATAGPPKYAIFAAALGLVVLLCAGFAVLHFLRPDRLPKTARVTAERTDTEPLPKEAGTGESAKPPLLDEAAVLHHIALVEQQARLQASLDLMPKDLWFAEQRAANEELLAKFKAAVGTSAAERYHERPPSLDGGFDKGETL
jgi:hypothetical protein